MDREVLDEIKRHFEIVVESVRSEVQAVAEGQLSLAERMEARFGEVHHEFEETRQLIRLSYSELDRRVQKLETDAR